MILLHEEEHPALAWPIGISLAVHAILLLLAILAPAHLPQEQKETLIEVWPTTPAEIAQAQKGSLRIADIDEPAVQKRPDKAKFAGMYDSSVAKETVAVGRQGTGGKKGKGKQAAKRTPIAKKGKKGTKGKKDLYNVDQNVFAMREPTPQQIKPKSSEGSVGRVDIGGGGSSGDYFPDVKVGEHTYLNVLRYPEISYFVRLKRVFRTTFDPGPPLRAYFSTNQIARGSVEVVLGVSVDRTGRLAELFVLRGSNIPGYDHEAMRTIKASSPFTAPPEKLLASDGQLRMMWTFTVYL